jgi:hypothetical protein
LKKLGLMAPFAMRVAGAALTYSLRCAADFGRAAAAADAGFFLAASNSSYGTRSLNTYAASTATSRTGLILSLRRLFRMR